MEKKHIYLGLGALALVGLGIWANRSNKDEVKSNYTAGKCWTCSEAEQRQGRCTKCGTKLGGATAVSQA